MDAMDVPLAVVREPGFSFAQWLTFGLVCTNLPREEVERKLQQHAPGTRAGWVIADKGEYGGANPVAPGLGAG